MRTSLHRTALLTILAIAAVLTGLTPVAADDDTPTTRTEQTYFTCDPATGTVANVEAAQTHAFGWDLTKPTDGFENATGSRCSLTTSRHTFLQPFEARFAGTFTGNIDAVTVEIWRAQEALSTHDALDDTVHVDLTIDGQPVFAGPVKLLWDGPHTIPHRGRFTVTDVGLLTEPGDGTAEREVEVLIRSNREVEFYGWNTTDMPSGLTFNPAESAQVIVAAAR